MNKFQPVDSTKAYVFKNESQAGSLSRTRLGAVFEYDQAYLTQANGDSNSAIAYQLPISSPRYTCTGVNLHPFFAGLLPEGLRLQALISSVKSSKDDLFSLLLASSRDCIGDIWLAPDTQPKPIPVDSDQIETFNKVIFADLFKRSIYNENPDARALDISISGVQDKISARMISFPVRLKSKRHDYILKLNSKETPLLVENEYFFMSMAVSCGLNVAPVKLVYDKERNSGLLVQRFDRVYDKKAKRLIRIHQEDACQFLNYYPGDKYRLSFRQIADGVAQLCSATALDVALLLKLKAFSYCIGNGDLHAKNISLVTEFESNLVRLAPAYDLLSTAVYGDMRMALEMEGRKDNLKRKDFISFAKRFDVRAGVIEEMLDVLCVKATPWLAKLDQIGFGAKKTKALKILISKRLNDLAS